MNEPFELIPLNGEARRQYINARETFMAERVTAMDALEFEGGMRWRTSNDREYLTRFFKRGQSKSLGLRSPDTEVIYQSFCARRADIVDRLTHLRERLQLHAKLNRAYGLHSVDSTTIRILRGFSDAGLDDALLVVGGSALFAYQCLAGVRIGNYRLPAGRSCVARMSLTRLSLVANEPLCGTQLQKILNRIDKSFVLESGGGLVRAANSTGYEIEIFEDAGLVDGCHSNHDWAAERKDMHWLLSAPKVKSIIIGVTGTMALMTAVDPRAFVLHRIWAISAGANEPFTTAWDEWDAHVVVKLVDHFLPQYDFGELEGLSQEVYETIAALRETSKVMSPLAVVGGAS